MSYASNAVCARMLWHAILAQAWTLRAWAMRCVAEENMQMLDRNNMESTTARRGGRLVAAVPDETGAAGRCRRSWGVRRSERVTGRAVRRA
jgi:hypothetical protein